MSVARHTAHLASDRNPNFTACGEPWQGWQEPFDADLYRLGADRATLSPYEEPRPRQDSIRQCQACLRVAITHKELA